MSAKLNVMKMNPIDSDPIRPATGSSRQPLTHFFIYENLNLVGDRVFDKDEITIGSSKRADVFLDHGSIADIHALVNYKDDQVFLTNHHPQDGLRLNGRAVGLAELQHEDVIDIGPFSLKIELVPAVPASSEPPSATYAVRLVNRYASEQARQSAAEQLSRMMRVEQSKILALLAKPHFVLKKGLGGIEAARVQNALLKGGVVCDVRLEETQGEVEAAEQPVLTEFAAHPAKRADLSEQETHDPNQVTEEPNRSNLAAETPPAPIVVPVETVAFTDIYQDEEDEDEEETWEAPFSLPGLLDQASRPTVGANRSAEQWQVVKTIGESVVDVCHLKGRKRYYVPTDEGRLCLVSTRSRGDGHVTISSAFTGYMENSSGEATADLEGYKIPEYKQLKKRDLYRIPLPDDGAVVIEAAGGRYRIAPVESHPTPQVATIRQTSDFSWRHWASSLGVHFFLLLCFSVYLYFQAIAPMKPEPHFVKIDPSLLRQLQQPEVPPKPKTPPPPKPEPEKAVETVRPQKEKPVRKKAAPTKVARNQKSRRKGANTGPVSKHPKAGGGFGEGNIKNRNINQTGILSVLGSSKIGGPSEAIASVTNLDAVPVPGATDKNFSVGGLKGALGNGKIAVATGEIMQTKGSRQVLRSAGARGKGEVAALERGTTGKKQVQAMVTAKMSRTVQIKGGMSREMVKRVIDQHLEEITYCYETALMSNPNILGRIVFEWKIKMDGSVGEIRIVNSSVNSHEIHQCIKSAIKSWQFPKPTGAEVVVSYPFVFDLVTF